MILVDLKVEEEDSAFANTSRLFEDGFDMHIVVGISSDKLIEMINLSDLQTKNFLVRNLELILNKIETRNKGKPIFNMDNFIKKLMEDFYNIFNDHYITDTAIHDFRTNITKKLELNGFLSLEKLENFTRNVGLQEAIRNLFKNISDSPHNSKETISWELGEKINILTKKVEELSVYEKTITDHEKLMKDQEERIFKYIEEKAKTIKNECLQSINSRFSIIENKLTLIIAFLLI